jgi:hypothetical protein
MARAQVIVVMGVTGVGKSTFIQYATGKEVKIGHGQEACECLLTLLYYRSTLTNSKGTAEVKMYQIPDTDVYLMDTPGFDDTYISDADILKNIATALVDAFNDQVEIQGALYVHPVTEVKMRGSGRKNLLMFQSVLGMKGMNHCRLVTTKWSKQEMRVSEDRERELCQKKEFWQPLLAAGAQTVRFDDSMESAIDIIKPLVYGRPFKPLLIKEIVNDRKTIDQTKAGREVNDDIEKARKIHLAEIADLNARAAQADRQYRTMMEEERREHQEKLEQLERDKETLRTATPPRSSGRFGRWIARGCAWIGGGAMTLASGGILAPAAALLIAGTEVGAQVHKHSR